MTVKFANSVEVQTSNNLTGWSWRQDHTRAWYAIQEDHPLVQAAIAVLQQRARNCACSPKDERDMARCLC